MLLSDQDLIAALADRRLIVDPPAGLPAAAVLPETMVQPASVEVRLGDQFRVFSNHRHACINPRARQDDLTELVEVPAGEPFILHPGEFVLGATLELVGVDRTLAARMEGKSSLGRLGLVVHSTAGWIDPGFRDGHITLELSNVNTMPMMLWPGDPVGQLCVFQLSSPSALPYGHPRRKSRYQGQDGPTPSRSWLTWATRPDLPVA